MTGGVAPRVPIVLVTAGADTPPYSGHADRLAASLASRRQRVLCVSTEPVVPETPRRQGGQPFATAPYLWHISASAPDAWQRVHDDWVPDFDLLLVTGGAAPWPMGWGRVATHALLLLAGSEGGWRRLQELPPGLPVGCVATGEMELGRESFNALAGAAERAGRRPVQWLGLPPGERGEWCRLFQRLLRRTDSDTHE